MRLDKLLSNLKYGSRKEVKTIISRGEVFVNGEICNNSEKRIDPNRDTIVINGMPVFYKENLIVAIHKPKGYLSANKDLKYPVVFDLLPDMYKRVNLKMCGRLDLDASGLMILSVSGTIVHQLSNPNQHVDKTYEVKLDRPFNKEAKNQLLNGVTLTDVDGSKYFAQAKDLSFENDAATIIIDQGKFHQVKKMFNAVEFHVVSLKRTGYGKLKLNLEEGDFREVTLSEIV